MLLADANKRWKARASAAYRSAVTSHYPDFFAKEIREDPCSWLGPN